LKTAISQGPAAHAPRLGGKAAPCHGFLPIVSLGLLVYFADHLVHSIQVDAIITGVERSTLAVIRDGLFAGGQDARTCRSGRCQSPRSARGTSGRCIRAGCWPAPPGRGFARGCGRGSANTWWPGRHWRGSGAARRVIRPPGPQAFVPVLDAAVRNGFERTLEQDAALGIRQLVDIACKALSPAVNDPYTAAQAVAHLSVIFCALATRPLGNHVTRDGHGAAVIVPGRRSPDYLAVMCGLIRRCGAREPTVAHALLRLLGNRAAVAGEDPERRAAIDEQARIIIADAEREIAQPVGLAFPHAEAEAVRQSSSLGPADVTRARSPAAGAAAGLQHRAKTHHWRESGLGAWTGAWTACSWQPSPRGLGWWLGAPGSLVGDVRDLRTRRPGSTDDSR
jgi:hypothetical protein